MTSPPAHVLVADAVLPVDAPALAPGWVAIAEGRIADLGPGRPPRDRGPIVELPGQALIPAFVNAHVHLGASFLEGASSDLEFWPWLADAVQPRVAAWLRGEGRVEAEADAVRAAESLLEGGVGFAAESFLDVLGRDAMVRAGLPGIFFREFFGVSAGDLAEEAERAARRVESDLATLAGTSDIEYGLAPHALYTCPPSILEVLHGLAKKNDLLLTLHLEESPEEHDAFGSQRGPLHGWLVEKGADRFLLDRRPVQVLESLGLLDVPWVFVHGVQLEAVDLEILARAGASLVHCPSSNMRLAEGVAPVEAALEAGLVVGLGTDSLGSTGRLDLFQEMRLLLWSQRARARRVGGWTAGRALAMATLESARCLGEETTRGSLGVGKWADLTSVALELPLDRASAVDQVVWKGSPSAVRGVWLRGRRVVPRGSAS